MHGPQMPLNGPTSDSRTADELRARLAEIGPQEVTQSLGERGNIKLTKRDWTCAKCGGDLPEGAPFRLRKIGLSAGLKVCHISC